MRRRCVPVILALLSLASVAHGDGIVRLVSGWEYRWGDSPFDADGTPLWAREGAGADTQWQAIAAPSNPPGRDGQTLVWYRVRLPGVEARDASLFVYSIDLAAEFYVDGKLIYKWGEPGAPGRLPFRGWPWHLVPVAPGYGGTLLYVRVASDYHDIGLWGDISIGPGLQHTTRLVWHDLPRQLVATLSLVIAVIFLVLYVHRREPTSLLLALVTAWLVVRVVSYMQVTQLMLNAPLVWEYVRTAATIAVIALVTRLVHEMLEPRYRRITRVMVAVLAAAFVLVPLASVTGATRLCDTYTALDVVAVAAMLLLGVLSVRGALSGDREARLLTANFMILAALSLYSILGTNGMLPWGGEIDYLLLFQLTVGLALILSRRLLLFQSQLEGSTEKLAEQAGQLRDLNERLENKVAERTRQLERANRRLREEKISLQITSITDGLTGLYNRTYALDRFRERARQGTALRQEALDHHARPRSLQAGQRLLRPPGGRHGDAAGRCPLQAHPARERPRGPLRRRGVPDRAPRDRRGRGRPGGRAHPQRDRRLLLAGDGDPRDGERRGGAVRGRQRRPAPAAGRLPALQGERDGTQPDHRGDGAGRPAPGRPVIRGGAGSPSERQRMLAAAGGRPVDRVPWAPRMDLWAIALRARGTLPAGFEGLDTAGIADRLGVACHAVTCDRTVGTPREDQRLRGLGLTNHPDYPFHVEMHGVDVAFEHDGAVQTAVFRTPHGDVHTRLRTTDEMKRNGISLPFVDSYAIRRADDFEAIGWLFEHVQVVPEPQQYARFSARIGDRGLAVAAGPVAASPMHLVLHELVAMDQFFYLYADERERLTTLARRMEPVFDAILAAELATDAEMIFWGGNYDQDLTWPPFFEEEIAPWLRRAADRAHAAGKLLLTHCDGENRALLPLYPQCGFDVAESVCPAPMTQLSLRQLREGFGPGVSVWGGVPSVALLEASVKDAAFDRWLADLVAEIERDPARIIVGVSDNVPPDASLERLARVGKAVTGLSPR